MFPAELGASWTALALIAVSTVGAYVAMIVFSRITGLRSFAQMTNFDVAATVMFGSIAATTAVTRTTPLLQGAVALAVLFTVQALIARWRLARRVESAVDNAPLLLMSGSTVLEENLTTARMTDGDLRSKLRLAGVTRTADVRAVVLETTGTVSVLTREPDGPPIDLDLFAGVRGHEQLIADESRRR
ncbi:uncharacterized membrane protein YcaP (DUF421 family) [Haloactinopolyspora alba]|uniref:Uncharacterized membrane protein YcaP (DUF421 family) n=1 Tax=Haloactinopolyspora alba TaxID=648780 RepID=A0A2P8D597_9ACTN|nr:YetF domain-containing protein [Haloactinopolyspora alba]PSK92394.1 uncharacterized membrane protein YcaP (DUF421 family) [Haloactinopolyspora alba]